MPVKKDAEKIKTPPLDTEVASQLQDPFSPIFMGVLRPNDPLLIERGLNGSQAFELYRDLRRDGKVFAGLQKRTLAVVSRDWSVEPVTAGASGTRDAEIVADALSTFGFDRMCQGLFRALLVGWQPAEIVWTRRTIDTKSGRRDMIVPARVPMRAHQRFVYVQDDDTAPELRMLTQGNMHRGIQLPDRKFIVHRVNDEDDNPYGIGLGLQLYWPVFFKRRGVLAWSKFLDRFGLPIPWGKYPREATPREKGTLFDALRAVSNDGLIMTPEGTMIELLESKINGSVTPHQSHVEFMDDWIMEVILGQSPRGKDGGALAASANEREDVRLELSQADSDLLSETLNHTLIKWICEYNGLEPCNVYRRIEKPADTQAESATDSTIYSMGFEMTEEGVKSKYGEHWQKRAMPSAPPQPVVNPFRFAEPSQPTTTTDAIDDAVAAELDNWRAIIDPMAQPIRAYLAQAAKDGLTAAQVLDKLPQVLADMDAAPLATALTSATFAARVAGAAGVSKK